jgi:hypothetical protein
MVLFCNEYDDVFVLIRDLPGNCCASCVLWRSRYPTRQQRTGWLGHWILINEDMFSPKSWKWH